MDAIRLTGRSVTLREFTEADVDGLHAVVGDERVTDSMAMDALTRDQTTRWLGQILDQGRAEPRREFFLAIEAESTVAGFARLSLEGSEAGDLGFAIGADHWGRRYAPDAAAVIIDFGFERLGLHRIAAQAAPTNHGSMAVLTRLGFLPEGRIRDHVRRNGNWEDSIAYGLLAHEWSSPTRR